MMKIIETTETPDGGLRITVEVNAEMLPPLALEAGKDTAFSWLRSYMEDDVRVQHMTDEELTELVSAACLAMLRSWPGVEIIPVAGTWPPFISLPLPKERRNGEG